MDYSLERVKITYQQWGEHPFSYKLSCIVTFLGREKFLRQRTVERLQLQPGDTVLDLACGTGLNFPYIEEQITSQGTLVAFDYSAAMLTAARQRAQRNGWRNVEFLQGDAATLTLPYQVDGVLSTLGVSAIPHHREALERSVNALKTGGRIALLDAQLPTGIWRVFNPLLAALYGQLASWDPKKNIPVDLEAIVGQITMEEYNGGTMYIVLGVKHSDQGIESDVHSVPLGSD